MNKRRHGNVLKRMRKEMDANTVQLGIHHSLFFGTSSNHTRAENQLKNTDAA